MAQGRATDVCDVVLPPTVWQVSRAPLHCSSTPWRATGMPRFHYPPTPASQRTLREAARVSSRIRTCWYGSHLVGWPRSLTAPACACFVGQVRKHVQAKYGIENKDSHRMDCAKVVLCNVCTLVQVSHAPKSSPGFRTLA